jgi:hypothetical protein
MGSHKQLRGWTGTNNLSHKRSEGLKKLYRTGGEYHIKMNLKEKK